MKSPWRELGRWPLLAAAALCITAALSFDVAADDTEETRAFLFAAGAIMLGAWLTMLEIHGHDGTDDDTPPPGDPPDDDSGDRVDRGR